MIYKPGLADGSFQVPGVHDPENVRPMRILLRPLTWQANTIYKWVAKDRFDVVIPTDFGGLYHQVSNPGKSNASTEPTFSAVIDGITEDFRAGKTEGLTWIAKPYDFLLAYDESVSDVEFAPSGGVTLASSSYSDNALDFTIAAIAVDAAARTAGIFSIKSHVTTPAREFDLTFEFNLGEW